MTKPGPRPRPTALKVLHGTRPDRVNRAEPQPPAGMPPTTGLSKSAQTLWKRLAPEVERRANGADWDRESLAVYCEAVVIWRRAAADIAKRGILVPGDRGKVKNPALQIFRDQAAIIRGFAQEFGFTPSSRSGIKLPEAPNDEREALLG